MKNLITLLSVVLFTTSLFAQTDSLGEDEMVIKGNRFKVTIKEKKIVTETPDGLDTIIEREVKEITIVTDDKKEKEGETVFENKIEEEIENALADLNDEIGEEEEELPPFIETDWFNFQWGLNTFMNTAGDFEMDANRPDLEISTGRSVNFQWNIVQQAVNIYRGRVRLIYGVGIDYNNYHFNKQVDLVVDSDPLETVPSAVEYRKNKLVTQYLTVPALIDLNIGKKGDGLKLAFGPMSQYLIGSHQRKKWNDNGRNNSRVRDDFNLEKFRVGYEVQFGYGSLVLYGKYFPNSMFKADKGPDVRTVAAGIIIGRI